jgi:hypothetical protein
MALIQPRQVVPPIIEDKQLQDFASVIQSDFAALFQAGHTHVGKNGVRTSFPASNEGMVGDIVLGIVNGTAYLFFKTTSKDWYKVSGVHV